MVVLRRIRRGEFDAERLALLVILAVVALGALWLVSGLPTPRCLFRAWTGLPCLTCGGTRCVRLLLTGDLAGAAGWNPLIFAGLASVGFFAVYAVIVTTFRLPRIRVEALSPRAWIVIRLGVVVIVAANWIYLVFRLSGTG